MSIESVLGFATLIISALGVIVWYFFDNWFTSVNRSIEVLSHRIDRLEKTTDQVKSSVERYLDHAYLRTIFSKVIREENIVPELHQIQTLMSEQQLTKEKLQSSFGKIIHIEENMKDQEKKLRGMYDTLNILIRYEKSKKKPQ